MVHPFLRRRAGLEPVTYPHPKLKPVLERTMGVPLFQEQGMRMAIEAAGFSPGEADQLRRAMGHKRSRERMREIYPRLVDGMVANGIDRAAAEQLFHMLEGFADYGFPESHAASFALLAYASAYVKCHHPAIFAAAILNVQPMGFYSTEVLVNDARRHGVVVKPIEVNASEYWSHVDADGALRLGFHLIRGLGEAQRKRLEAALAASGPFADLLDFARRTQLEKEAIENLAVAGAFAPWFASRREAMWALRALDEREARGELGKLMDVDEPPVRLRTRRSQTSDGVRSLVDRRHAARTGDRRISARSSTRGASYRPHVLPSMPPNLVCRVGGLVITRQRPGTAKGFVFLTLEDETGLVNVIVRPDVYERYRRTIRSAIDARHRRQAAKGERLHRHARPPHPRLQLPRHRQSHPRPQLPLTPSLVTIAALTPALVTIAALTPALVTIAAPPTPCHPERSATNPLSSRAERHQPSVIPSGARSAQSRDEPRHEESPLTVIESPLAFA